VKVWLSLVSGCGIALSVLQYTRLSLSMASFTLDVIGLD
jgi:hypothetical protein